MEEERRWRAAAADHEEPDGYAGTAITEPTKSSGSADLQGPAEKQLETKTTAVEAQKAHPDIPNGGFRAYLIVLGAWFMTFVSFGYISAFGVYQSYYEQHQLSNETPSNIAWIGSLQLFFIFFSGLFIGYAFDAGYHTQIVLAGSICLVVAMFTTAECTHLWQFILAQGVCGGIGAGFVFLPATAVVGHWFTTKRALVYGIIATGSSLGGVCFPIMLNRLFVQVGFQWAVRTAGFITLACVIAANFLLRPRLPPRTRGAILEPHHLRDPAYAFFVISASLMMLGLYTPIFYIATYAISKGVDENMAFYVLSILNACSIVGRVLPNIFSNKIGPLNILLAASTLAGILNFVWLSASTTGGIVAFACFYGIASGSYVSTIPSCLANMTKNMNELGSRTSLCFSFMGIAGLCGTPITGALLQGTSFTRSACFSGAITLAGVIAGFASRYVLTKRSGSWKV